MPGIIDLPKFNYEDLEEIVTVQARNQDFMWGVLTRPKWTKLPLCIFDFTPLN